MSTRGIFLPTLVWTTDRQKVGEEMQWLLALRAQLNALVATTSESDDSATWYRMAQASLFQMDRDIDDLVEWLGDAGHETDSPDSTGTMTE
ncbi:MAG: hypothetical protein J0H69_03370 [Burkholderiales bacterium]|nr:hypothetical protein [Burkholderiales bacterium]